MGLEVNQAVPLFLVYDVPVSLAFYRDVLSFEVVRTSQPFDDAEDNFGWVYLRRNGVHLMLNNMYEDNVRPSQPDATRARHHRDTALYIDCADVDEAYAYLQSKGLAVKPPVDTWYGMRQVSLLDPDGYTLVFQRPVEAVSSK